MGWHSDYQYSAGSDPRQAFGQMIEDARFSDGHDGENGSIGQCCSYQLIHHTPVLLAEAQRLVHDAVDGHDGDGDRFGGYDRVAAGCPVADPSSFTVRTRTLTVDGDARIYYSYTDLLALAQPKLTLKPGERITEITVTANQATRRAQVTSTKGKTAKTFHIVRAGSLTPLRGAQPQPTLALARAELKRALAALPEWETIGGDGVPVAYDVIAVERRHDGAGLICGQAAVTKRKLTLQVTIAKPKDTVTTAGFYFGAMVNS